MRNIKEDEKLSILNHSCAHLLAQAVKHLYPHALFWVGPVIEEGFYYDIDLGDDVIKEEDLERKKKVNISNLLYTFDDISRTNKLLLNDKIMYDDIHTNIYDILKSMNKKEMDEIISKLDTSNKSILIIENQDE